MNTRVFLITYTNGKQDYIQTDAVDVADQINRTFGLTVEQAEEFGVKVEMMAEDFVVPGTAEAVMEPTETFFDRQRDLDLEAASNTEGGTPPAVSNVEGHAPTITQTTDAPPAEGSAPPAPWAQ